MNPATPGKQNFWLRLGYWVIIGYAVFVLGIAVAGILLFPAYASRHADSYTPNNSWKSAQTQAALQQLGWPAESVGWVYLGLDILTLSVGLSLSFTLLRRKNRDSFSLLLAFIFLLGGNTGTAFQPAISHIPALDYFFNNIMGVVVWQFFFIILFLFPDGKPVPRWTRWVILGWFGYMLWTLLNPNPVDRPLFWLAFILVFCALGSQVYRQWKYSDPVQKQQTKWVAYAIVMMVVIVGFMSQFAFKPPTAEQVGRDLIVALIQQGVFSSGFLFIMTAILIAILRYHLYDIDLIIRRTLVYSLLTALLGLVYYTGVTLLQSLFTAASGQTSPAALVFSTLLIAALFNPLRKRIQDFIDRRFYRRKYDAELALAEFAAAVRSETDLERLTQSMLQIVQTSIQPERTQVWMKSSSSSNTVKQGHNS